MDAGACVVTVKPIEIASKWRVNPIVDLESIEGE
jgi:hypothetical protein